MQAGNLIPTPHIKAAKNEIAKVVIMPGDPLRAKFIAENFLENPKLVNTVRNMFMYTGKYKDREITIAGSGMGMASIGIYSYELFKFYDVDCIIRVGSAGSYQKDINIYDIINVKSAYSESTFAQYAANIHADTIDSSQAIFKVINDVAKMLDQDFNKGLKHSRYVDDLINLKTGTIHSSDVFYRATSDWQTNKKLKACLAVEMESFALFANATYLKKDAACLVTISDSLVTSEAIPADFRETSFKKMMFLALEAANAYQDEQK